MGVVFVVVDLTQQDGGYVHAGGEHFSAYYARRTAYPGHAFFIRFFAGELEYLGYWEIGALSVWYLYFSQIFATLLGNPNLQIQCIPISRHFSMPKKAFCQNLHPFIKHRMQ